MALITTGKGRISEHGGEIILLGLIGCGILLLIGGLIVAGILAKTAPKEMLGDVSPFLLIEQSIIGAIKDRWNARLQGQSNDQLARSAPLALPAPGAPDPAVPAPSGAEGDPLHVVPEKPAGDDTLDLAGAELPR